LISTLKVPRPSKQFQRHLPVKLFIDLMSTQDWLTDLKLWQSHVWKFTMKNI
jgi:hypothetical protein